MNYLTAILAMTITLFTGGTMAADQPFQQPNNQPVVQPVTNENSPSFEYIASPYPAKVESALTQLRFTGGYQVIQGDKTYVVIGLGKRSNGGYQVVVDGVTKTANGQLVVGAHEVKPAPGAMTIQVISFPTKVIALPKTTLPVTVELK